MTFASDAPADKSLRREKFHRLKPLARNCAATVSDANVMKEPNSPINAAAQRDIGGPKIASAWPRQGMALNPLPLFTNTAVRISVSGSRRRALG
jgi:hypothetical protein